MGLLGVSIALRLSEVENSVGHRISHSNDYSRILATVYNLCCHFYQYNGTIDFYKSTIIASWTVSSFLSFFFLFAKYISTTINFHCGYHRNWMIFDSFHMPVVILCAYQWMWSRRVYLAFVGLALSLFDNIELFCDKHR